MPRRRPWVQVPSPAPSTVDKPRRGDVAKWQGRGLQNPHSAVRIRPSPPFDCGLWLCFYPQATGTATKRRAISSPRCGIARCWRSRPPGRWSGVNAGPGAEARTSSRASVGTGRRGGLKIRWPDRPCGFKSLLAHHILPGWQRRDWSILSMPRWC